MLVDTAKRIGRANRFLTRVLDQSGRPVDKSTLDLYANRPAYGYNQLWKASRKAGLLGRNEQQMLRALLEKVNIDNVDIGTVPMSIRKAYLSAFNAHTGDRLISPEMAAKRLGKTPEEINALIHEELLVGVNYAGKPKIFLYSLNNVPKSTSTPSSR